MLSILNGPSAVVSPIAGGGASAVGSTPAVGDKSAPSGDFGQMLASMVKDTVDTMNTGEATALAGMQGKASVQNVVQAVMAAEQALHAATAVRDKVVSAYLEISRMSI